jgi:hypothetical protein
MSATEIPGYGKIFRSNIHEQERSRLYYAHAYFANWRCTADMNCALRKLQIAAAIKLCVGDV